MPLRYQAQSSIAMSDCKVKAEGDFGSIEWTLSQKMYVLLPADGRDELLALKSRLDIVPTFSLLSKSIIMAASGARPVKNPAPAVFQPIECSCYFGSLIWKLSSSFDAVPAPYRSEIYSYGESLAHDTFEHDICPSIAKFVGREFPKYDHIFGRVYVK